MKVLTQKGFRNFDAIISKGISDKLLKIELSNGETITCTEEHQFLSIDGEFIEACFLEEGDILFGKISVEAIEQLSKEQEVCDLLNVEETHSYITNGVVSHNCLYLDEFAFVPSNIAEEFFTSVYPTISSGTTSKILISSTPNGMNHFYKMWTDAVEGQNGFTYISANWREVPGRDQKWADEQFRVLGEQKFMQEMECEFLGSTGTLISAVALRAMSYVKPISTGIENLKVYEEVKPENLYFMCVDTSRGKGLDYSAFAVINATTLPYKVVATYKDNEVSPLVYPAVLKQVGSYYNNALQLVETNDNGQQIVDILFEDYEYENILSTVEHGKSKLNKKLLVNFGYGQKSGRGIRTTKSVKRLGCTLLKNLIERQQLIIQDYDIISELSTFVTNGTSYEAEEGSHDDLVMCLVLFAWLTNQKFFSDMTDVNIRRKINEEQLKIIEEASIGDTILAGHIDIDNGRSMGFIEDGAVWNTVER